VSGRAKGVARGLESFWRRHGWATLGVLAATGLVLGFIGFLKLGDAGSVVDAMYRDLQLLVLEGGYLGAGPIPWELEVARFLLPVVAAYAGLKGLALVFWEQVGLIRVRLLPPRVIVCGLGERGFLTVRALREKGVRTVVIEKRRDDHLIGPCRRTGAVVLIGDATNPDMLRAAGVRRARRMVVLCGADQTGLAVAACARELCASRRAAVLDCVVPLNEPRLCAPLMAREMAGDGTAGFRLDCLDLVEVAAGRLLQACPPFDDDGKGPDEAADGPHLLIVGLGRLGQSVLTQAARRWAAAAEPAGRLLRVTGMDTVASASLASLIRRFPRLAHTCDLKSVDAAVGFAEFRDGGYLVDPEGRLAVTHVYVCLEDEPLAVTAALDLERLLEERHIPGRSVPITMRLPRASGLVSLLGSAPARSLAAGSSSIFRFVGQTDEAEMLIGGTYEILAQAIHEEYMRAQLNEGQTPQSNPALVPWSELPETLKESNRDQAANIGRKLRTIGCGIGPWMDWDAESFRFSEAEVELLSRMEHERWVGERLRDGWTYDAGPKDVERKRSPYLVPWEELDEQVREWDRVAVRGIPTFLARAGFQVVRLQQLHDSLA